MCQALRVRQRASHPGKVGNTLETVMLASKSGPFRAPQDLAPGVKRNF